MRFELFKGKVAFVEAQNEKFEKGESSWKAGINEMADRTIAEHQMFKGLRFPKPTETTPE
jgi:hypothetical protein